MKLIHKNHEKADEKKCIKSEEICESKKELSQEELERVTGGSCNEWNTTGRKNIFGQCIYVVE